MTAIEDSKLKDKSDKYIYQLYTISLFIGSVFESKEFLDQFDTLKNLKSRPYPQLRFLGLKDLFESVGETPGNSKKHVG